MSNRKKKESKIDCIAYLSRDGNVEKVKFEEDRQERYIREYARAHNIDIVGVMRRHAFGMRDVNRQFQKMCALIER